MDDSNIWIEGMRVSAVKKKLAKDIWDASERDILDQTWRLDFGMLLKLVTGYKKANIGYAALYESTPPDTDSIWSQAEAGASKWSPTDASSAGRRKSTRESRLRWSQLQ